jgi:seryl-tRNA synthetase
MAVDYEPEKFYQGLIDHRLIIPVGVPGVFGRGAIFEDVLERLNGLITQLSKDDGAEIYTFPPVINRQVLEKVNYLDSFPQLCGSVHSFFGKEQDAKVLSQRVHEGKPWGELLGQTQVVLNPAACYPLYPTIAGRLPRGGRLATMLHWVFRHEPSAEPTRMQSFRVREFVRVGAADEVVEWRDMWLQRGLTLLQSLGLPAAPEVASDPFFGRTGRIMAVNQKEQRLKFEVVVPVISEESPTAVCSFNFHQEHFGHTFDIRTFDDRTANSACLGFGLERIVMALFKTHGFDVSSWPRETRARLWA